MSFTWFPLLSWLKLPGRRVVCCAGGRQTELVTGPVVLVSVAQLQPLQRWACNWAGIGAGRLRPESPSQLPQLTA